MEKINHAQFLVSAVSQKQWPSADLPEFCFIGRSNVGKSSFLNTICNNKKLARVSQTPGKTQMLNFFSINNDVCRFVDVPGYGFAKVSKTQKDKFATMMEEYFTHRHNLKAVFLLLDFRHQPTKDDITMVQYLQYHHIKFYLVATKADKVKNSLLVKNKNNIITTLQLDALTPIICFSTVTKTGVEAVMMTITNNIAS